MSTLFLTPKCKTNDKTFWENSGVDKEQTPPNTRSFGFFTY